MRFGLIGILSYSPKFAIRDIEITACTVSHHRISTSNVGGKSNCATLNITEIIIAE